MDIVAELPAAQALNIDQRSTLRPTPRFVTVEDGEFGDTIVPVPTSTDHVPIPPVGVAAARVVLPGLIQIVWFSPALAILGVPVTAIVTLATFGEQVPPLETDHQRTFRPGLSVTCVVARLGVAMVPLPCAKDQIPVLVNVPIDVLTVDGVGGLAVIVVMEKLEQMVWLGVLITAAAGAG